MLCHANVSVRVGVKKTIETVEQNSFFVFFFFVKKKTNDNMTIWLHACVCLLRGNGFKFKARLCLCYTQNGVGRPL